MSKQSNSKKRHLPYKKRYIMRSDSTDYQKGYADGLKASYESSELDAYYVGVGYAKKASGDKHIGFNTDLERQQFEDGMKNKSKHFRSYRTEPPTFFERLFNGRLVRHEDAAGGYQKSRTNKTLKRLNKKRKKGARK